MKWFAMVLLTLFSATAVAGNYTVNVTRNGSDLYRVRGTDMFILTRYCYEYSYGSDAVLHLDGSSSALIFLDDKKSCDVAAIYGRARQAPGKYTVSVTRRADNWYEVDGTGLFVHTSVCVNLALGEQGLLDLEGLGTGTLYFLQDGDNCAVDGVYNQLRM